MGSDNPFTAFLWPVLAALAGALTALSYKPFVGMVRSEIAISLTVGATFAIFVGPLVAKWMFGDGPTDPRILGGLFYLMASGSNVLIPMLIRWLGRSFGAEERR